ncbi:hypothetical protein [Cloacibacterium normanense]|uniref:hypothetical protein n=1 Tax=Cloacibacterium normanense TaxID=237258 RepID=UPI0029392FCD|nr:hypothetical protein [Cloacibacterium normanense]
MKKFEIGVGMFGDLAFDKETRKFADPQQKLQEILAEIRLADELGIDVFALGEHHRPDYVVSSQKWCFLQLLLSLKILS